MEIGPETSLELSGVTAMRKYVVIGFSIQDRQNKYFGKECSITPALGQNHRRLQMAFISQEILLKWRGAASANRSIAVSLFTPVPPPSCSMATSAEAAPVLGAKGRERRLGRAVAEIDDGTCITTEEGCTDSSARNFVSAAHVDDGCMRGCIIPVCRKF